MKPVQQMVLIFLGMMVIFPAAMHAANIEWRLSSDDLECAQQMVFDNECAGKDQNLAAWNEGEDFPSLGLGHFIWYPEGKKGPHQESFRDWMKFLQKEKYPIPPEIKEMLLGKAPWISKDEFLEQSDSQSMQQLQEFLKATKPYQVLFISARLKKVLPRILAKVSRARRSEIRYKIQKLVVEPRGISILMDYVNFKGEGILKSERYAGQGWGLLQVLEMMEIPKGSQNSIQLFSEAAAKTLTIRVMLAPDERDGKRLKGWLKRVQRYVDYECPGMQPEIETLQKSSSAA